MGRPRAEESRRSDVEALLQQLNGVTDEEQPPKNAATAGPGSGAASFFRSWYPSLPGPFWVLFIGKPKGKPSFVLFLELVPGLFWFGL